MTKKELLSTTLRHLQDHRAPAEGFLVLVQGEDCTDAVLDSIIAFLGTAVRTIHDAEQKKRLSASLIQLRALQIQEKRDHEQEMDEADHLLEQQ